MPVDREGPIQRAIIAYLFLRLPRAVIHASPNSFGDLHGPAIARQVAKAKMNGMVPGWPDIECFWKGHALFFEVKAGSNTAQDTQKQVGADLIAQGAKWAVVRSVSDVSDCLRGWGLVP
jgi:hypothetical protein